MFKPSYVLIAIVVVTAGAGGLYFKTASDHNASSNGIAPQDTTATTQIIIIHQQEPDLEKRLQDCITDFEKNPNVKAIKATKEDIVWQCKNIFGIKQ